MVSKRQNYRHQILRKRKVVDGIHEDGPMENE